MLEPRQAGDSTIDRRTAMLFGLVLLVVTTAYLPVLPAPFVADDYVLYSPGVLAHPLKYLWQPVFRHDPSAVFLRPLPMLSFAVDNAVRGDSVIVPHVVNLILHLLTTMVIGLVVLRAGHDRTRGAGAAQTLGAAAGMLLFGLHPLATEAVSWVSARFDLMAGLFGVLGLYWWLRMDRASARNASFLFGALLSFAAAVFSKETALVFPAAAVGWSAVRFVRRGGVVRWKYDRASMVLVIWLIVIYFAIRWLALEQLGIGEGGISVNARSGLGYALALLWPFYHVGAPPWPLLLLAVMAEVALVITLALTTPEPAEMHTAPDTPWGLAGWLFVLTAGFLCLLPLWIVDALLFMEARFAYGLLIAFAMLGGWLACRVGRQRRLRRLVAAVVFIILALFAWPQQVRVGHWLDAGRRARSILDQTTTLVPRPAHDSVLVMVGVPFLDRYACYVFGIGLQEALEQRYGRDDFTVVRFDDPDAVGELPDSAYLLYYYYDDEQMELVRTPRVFSHP